MNPTSSGAEQPIRIRPDPVHLEDYWHVVRRRAWLVLLTTVVALAAAVWAASRSPQLYQASITLQVGDPRGRTGQIGDIDVSANLLWTDPVESELQQLTTQAVAKSVVDSLQLRAETPTFPRELLLDDIYVDDGAPVGRFSFTVGSDASVLVEGSDGVELARGQLGTSIEFAGVYLVMDPGVSPGSYDLWIVSRRAAEARVTGGLAASTRPETNLIDVTYTGTDQLLTPDILNAVASGLRDLGVRRLREWAKGRTEFIRKQLNESGDNLQAALEDVEAYKEQRGVMSLTSEETDTLK